MPAIDPSWLPRENGAVIGSWHLLLRYSISHSAGGVWFEHGVNREPMLGRQLQHLAIVMNDVLCAVRVEDGVCIPSLDEVRDELTARLGELQASCPDVVASIIEAIGRAPEPEADESDVKDEKPRDEEPVSASTVLRVEIDAIASKKAALAYAAERNVEGLSDGMKLREMKEVLVSALLGAPEPEADESDVKDEKPRDEEPVSD